MDLHIVQLMPLTLASLASVKSGARRRLVRSVMAPDDLRWIYDPPCVATVRSAMAPVDSRWIYDPAVCVQLMGHLPARAEGSLWHLYYSSSVHGYSLRTLFRLMTGLDSPILLVVMDTDHHVSLSLCLSVCLSVCHRPPCKPTVHGVGTKYCLHAVLPSL